MERTRIRRRYLEALENEEFQALPEPAYRIYVNVNWTGPVKDYGPARDGEADAVITHPEHGLLVLEVKSGEPSIDPAGHWHLGTVDFGLLLALLVGSLPGVFIGSTAGAYARAYLDRLLDAPDMHHTRILGNKLWHLALLELWLQRHVDAL